MRRVGQMEATDLLALPVIVDVGEDGGLDHIDQALVTSTGRPWSIDANSASNT